MAPESARMPTVAELVHAAEQLAKTGRSQVIHANGQPIAVLAAYEPERSSTPQHGSSASEPATAPRRRRKGRRFTMNDSLWNVLGIAEAAGPSDVGSLKDEYLAEAYASKAT